MTLTAAVFRTETTNARLTLPDNTYAMAGKKQVDGFELGFGQHYAGLAGLRRLHLPEEQDQDDGVATDKGNDFPNTPRNAFNIWSTYAVTPDFTVGGGAYYVDKQYGNTATRPTSRRTGASTRWPATASTRTGTCS